jgi:hypothetical protein
VTWQSRWRADLTRSGKTTIDRREQPVLIVGATIIVVSRRRPIPDLLSN